MTRKEMKKDAKECMKGNLIKLIGVTLVYTLLCSVCSGVCGAASAVVPVFFIGSLAMLVVVSPALLMGLICIYIKVSNREAFTFSDLFSKFDSFWSMFKVQFFSALYTWLWSMLLVIPGLIKSFSYSQASFIIAENPSMGANEAITLSRKMMNGHKWEYFVFLLSFILWWLLVGITFGLASLYVVPYLQTAQVKFYQKVKAEYEGKNVEFKEVDVNADTNNQVNA